MTCYYNTGKSPDTAATTVMSDQIPMLIDLDMVDRAKEMLVGLHLWTRSPLWYDEDGNRIDGRKFVPVTVIDVRPGNISFPIRLKFEDDKGKEAWAYMNLGNSHADSRSFANLFSLSDIRSRYPGISDEVWDLICRGKVRYGMTKLECKLSLGNPTEVDTGHDWNQTLDLWHYPDGQILYFEDGLLAPFRN